MKMRKMLSMLFLAVFLIAGSGAALSGQDVPIVVSLMEPESPPMAAVSKSSSKKTIQKLQTRLKKLGYLKKVNGKLDKATKSAIQSFQKGIGKPANGVADSQTVALIYDKNAPKFYPKLKKGMSNKSVLKMKKALNKLRKQLGIPKLKENGKYDNATVKAVKAYQKAAGFSVTGTATTAMQQKLFSKNPLPPVQNEQPSAAQPTPKPPEVPVPQKTQGAPGKTVVKPPLGAITNSVLAGPQNPVVLDGKLARVAVAYKGDGKSEYRVYVYRDGKGVEMNSFKANGETQYFSLIHGNGSYRVDIYRILSGNRAVLEWSEKVTLTTYDGLNGHRGSVNLINFQKAPQAVSAAGGWAKPYQTDTTIVEAVYQKLVNTMTYDYKSLNNLPAFYVPDLDKVLSRRLGVCYDMSSLFAGMLRAEGVPAKVSMGYSKQVGGYHAWVEAQVDGQWMLIDLSADAQYREYKMKYTMEKKRSDYTTQKSY